MKIHPFLQKISAFATRVSRAHLEADYFREETFITIAGLVALAAWIWVGQGVSSGQLPAGYGLALLGLVSGAFWLVYHLYRRHYLAAVGVLLLVQEVFIASMIVLGGELALGYLYLLVIATAGSLLGPLGALLAASGAAGIEWALALGMGGSLQGSSLLPGLVFVQYLAALISGQAAQGLYTALGASRVAAHLAQKHAEEARQHRGELHRTLKSLDLAYLQLQKANAELLQAREVADAALRFKKEFVAQTSHELRTPLNLIIGFSETMAFSQNAYGTRLPPPYLRDVTEIHRNSRHLLSLIDDILDLAKLDSGRMGLRQEPVNLQEVFHEVLETVRPLTQAKGLDLSLECATPLPAMWVDRARIHQVLLNLLSNAARLTRHGQISLRAVLGAAELLVQVQDTGPGIPADMLGRVFEEFRQVEETATSAGTTGLGLTISKRIIELHQGRIWAESQPGLGTTFSFTLPVQQLPPALPFASQRAPAFSSPAQPDLVVVGEEESGEVRLLQRHLEGYLVSAAPTWEAAIQLAAHSHARAVIVSDLADRPVDPAFAGLPVIACPLPGPRQTAQTLGVEAYVHKPVTIQALKNALDQVAPQARRLLIVDDDASALRLVERMLQGGETAYQLFRAYNGAEALARVQAQPPEAILLDLNMPESDGFELIGRLKGEAHTANIPVIVITGREITETLPGQPIRILHPRGFTPTEILGYLQAILSAVPPANVAGGTTAPPWSATHPE